MNKITGPVTRAAVQTLAADWAHDPLTTVEIVHREFNDDKHSGGYAFLCDRGLLIYCVDGGHVWSADPGDDARRIAKVEQYWRQSQHRNRTLELDDVSPFHRAAIATLVSGARSVTELPSGAHPEVTDAARADAMVIMLGRRVTERTEAAALRALASNDWLLDEPRDDTRAHPCPVCGAPALGMPWRYASVCDDCYPKTVCGDGRSVFGYNTHPGGGFEAKHTDDRSLCEEVSRSGLVWVDEHRCRMGEAKFGGIFVGVAPVREFRDDDAGYLGWLAAHRRGYVLNIARGHSAAAARLHRAGCRTIGGDNPRGGVWTGPYVKVCSDHADALQQWANEKVGESIPLCGTCLGARKSERPATFTQPDRVEPNPLSENHFEIHGPAAGSPVVEAWTKDYIRFERRPDWQEQARTKIRERCAQLRPAAGEVLHASFFGDKLANADIENVLLYYIDSFNAAGRNGIRFEHGGSLPPAPEGTRYPFCYRYALAPSSGTFADWQQGRTLASFDWTDLGAFAGDKKLAQVWLALARALDRDEVEVFEPAALDAPFAVRVQVRPPHGMAPVWGGLVKGIFDGVICAFQAHTDTTVLPEVVARLVKYLPAEPDEITTRLLDRRGAVRGAVNRLVSPYREGVKWDPADHLCVAGELLSAESAGSRWAIKGQLVEVARAT